MMSLVDHFERYLGEIAAGWSGDGGGHPVAFQVVRFPRVSGNGTIGFATLGLSRCPLRSASGKEIRQKLLMLVPKALRDGPVYFPDDFAVYKGNDDQIVVAWLVPISSNEASYVRQHGWRAFEKRLVENDPDLTNVFCAPLAAT